jgi:hypothetical protein
VEVMMRHKHGSRACYPAWAGLALLACLTAPPPARADGPMLSIRLTTGEQAIYSVSEVQRIGFDGDTLVVVKAGGSERYAAAAITKIEFLMEFSSVNDPREAAELVKAVHLFQNQPNPFSPETQIAFDLPKAGPAELVIYSVNGRLIRRLVKEARQAGRQTASWDGRNDAGEKVGSGIYFYQLTAPGVDESRRMILLP